MPIRRLGQKFVLLLTATALSGQLLLAQTLDLQWVKPYAQGLESKESLVLLKTPLESTIMRLELATWLTQVFGLVPDPKKFVPLTDLPKNSPDYNNAQAFIQAGLGSAPKGKFEPKGDYTRLEALALFARLLKLSAPSKAATAAWVALYKDGAQVSAQGKQFVAATAQVGLVVNVPDASELGADYVLTRGEAMVLVYQALVYQKKLPPLDPPVAQLKISAPELLAIEISPRDRSLKPGEIITITAKGTPDSSAVFSLGNLARGQALTESPPGTYSGSYTVKPGDYLVNPAVSVALSRGGLEDRKQKIAVLTLGNTPRPPADDQDTAALPPPPNFNSNSSPRPNYPSYTQPNYPPPSYTSNNNPPAGNFNPGLYRPDFRNPSNKASDLTLPDNSAPRITQRGYNGTPGKPFVPGDVLVVTLRGDPGGNASFRVDGFTADIFMKEESSGFYKAEVLIGKNLDVPSGTIRLMLTKAGKRAFETIPETISIVSR
jgi:hypothetical protein